MDSGVFSVLAYIERADPPHRMPMSELQRAMHPRYSQPGFSRLVQRMEADGLLERRPDPADRRATIVMTTRRPQAVRPPRTRSTRPPSAHRSAVTCAPREHEQLTALMHAVTERRAATA